MSCDDCLREARGTRGRALAAMGVLERAASAHGWELWYQHGTPGRMRVLAVPADSHGSVEDVMAAMRELRLPPGLPITKRRDAMERQRPPMKPARSNTGRKAFHLDGPMGQAIEIEFLT